MALAPGAANGSRDANAFTMPAFLPRRHRRPAEDARAPEVETGLMESRRRLGSQYGVLAARPAADPLRCCGGRASSAGCSHHRGDDAQQLAAGAARGDRGRALPCLRLHDLRRPAQFHLRAAAVRSHRLRHPGRDADRRLADRRELRHRHEPAARRAARASARARPSSAWASASLWSASSSTGR